MLNSVVGFFIYGVMQQNIGVAWDYWQVAIPIVIIGAPLGAFVASIIKRDYLLDFILMLIAVELTTTLWLVPFNQTALIVTAVSIIVCTLGFGGMLRYRAYVDRSRATYSVIG